MRLILGYTQRPAYPPHPLGAVAMPMRLSILKYFVYIILRVSQGQRSAGDVTVPQISPKTHRGMIIDAGSGGSRLHVFSWPAVRKSELIAKLHNIV